MGTPRVDMKGMGRLMMMTGVGMDSPKAKATMKTPKVMKRTTSGPRQLLINSFLQSRPKVQGGKGVAASNGPKEVHGVARGYSAQEEEVPPGEKEQLDECHVQAQALSQDQAQVDQGAKV